MPQHKYRARWTDKNGRSHEFEGYSDNTDREFIKEQVRSQTGARTVTANFVGSNARDNSSFRNDENQRRAEAQERLKSSGSGEFFSDTSSSSSSSSGGSQFDVSGVFEEGPVAALIATFLVGWAIFQYWMYIIPAILIIMILGYFLFSIFDKDD